MHKMHVKKIDTTKKTVLNAKEYRFYTAALHYADTIEICRKSKKVLFPEIEFLRSHEVLKYEDKRDR